MLSRERVVRLAPSDDAGDALVRIESTPLGRALVLDGAVLVGIVAESDIRRVVEARLHPRTTLGTPA
jgi:CBS domain-containing protein